jgi:type III restriction enzyme
VGKINRKAAYTVHFETDELVAKCVVELDKELRVKPMQYVIERGTQVEAQLRRPQGGNRFQAHGERDGKLHRLGSLGGEVRPDRQPGRDHPTDAQNRCQHPQGHQCRGLQSVQHQPGRLHRQGRHADQRAERPRPSSSTSPTTRLTRPTARTSSPPRNPRTTSARPSKAKRHIYDYVFTDSNNERKFVEELDASTEVAVYAKLPRSFFIPTPVGNYNPDWAIAFQAGQGQTRLLHRRNQGFHVQHGPARH